MGLRRTYGRRVLSSAACFDESGSLVNSIQLHAAVALLPGGLHATLEQHPLSLLGAHLLLGLGRIELLCLLVPDGRNGREGVADRQIK
jgi:hypothetical protein